MELKRIEQMMMLENQVELETKHMFTEGQYIRELHIPKGTLLVGKRHRNKTLNMLIKGSMTIHDEHNSFDIKAPWYGESEALTKKAGYAHEDSIFLNIHVTNETDLDIIEKEFIITEEEYLQLKRKDNICLG
jgi:hypothetical protein